MLRELRIRNLAIIEAVTVPLAPGLNVLTGETGAGKSMVVDAILLIRGARAQADVIRTDAPSASVEAVFDVAGHAGVATLLAEAGLGGAEPELLIRRELSRAGRHRAFVNDTPVTVALLERLGDLLVDVHGQQEHHRLSTPGRQLELLDRYAGTEALAVEVATLWGQYQEALEEARRLSLADRERAQRQDLLRFQIAELDAARLRPGEEAELRAERQRLQHAERLARGLAEVSAWLVEDPEAVLGRLGRAARLLRELGRIDAECLSPAELLEGAGAQVEEATLALRRLRARAQADPARLEEVQERLEVLTRLKRKYGDTEEALLAFRAEAARALDALEHHEELQARAERRAAELRAALLDRARVLSEARVAAARRLGAEVQRDLRGLGMERARFEVALTPEPEDAVSARGIDRVEFRFSANPGEDLRPLSRVASGGELSRAMLALQTVVGAGDRVPTTVFDEVDAGIGGRVAEVVADRLAAAAAGRQVLCVTHLPQIAARAHHHLLVTKTVRSGRTRATVTVLTEAARVEEIARMLGDGAAGETARRHARALLARGARDLGGTPRPV
jgi:DNA repair protein RecN (Recombination protein N)